MKGNHCLIDFYEYNTSKEDIEAYKRMFYNDAIVIGLEETGENFNPLSNRYKEWGIV